MTNPKYKNSPIVEAICEFNFDKTKSWDWTIPGILYSSLRDELPEKKEVRGMGFEFAMGKNIEPQVSKYAESVDRLQFWSKNNENIVQVAENRLIINRRKPYNGWDKFSAFIEKISEEYVKTAENDLVENLSLRYINKIDGLPDKIDLEEYFAIFPQFPKNLEEATGPLRAQGNFNVEILEGYLSTIRLNFFNQQSPKGEHKPLSWIIDINIVVDCSNGMIKLGEIQDLLKLAHDKVVETFESCIKENLRKIFGEN